MMPEHNLCSTIKTGSKTAYFGRKMKMWGQIVGSKFSESAKKPLNKGENEIILEHPLCTTIRHYRDRKVSFWCKKAL